MGIFKNFVFTVILFFTFVSCDKKEDNETVDESFFSNVQNRTFEMGFTSWSYGPTLQNVNETYDFIENNGDIYTEHFDNKIPWEAWISGTDLPIEFVQEVEGRANRRVSENSLVLAVSLLNGNRDDLALDFDDSPPPYSEFDDTEIEDAYFNHLVYLIEAFQPDYLVAAVEVNELKLHSPEKWDGFLNFYSAVSVRINEAYPLIPLSASVSIHNFLDNQGTDTNGIIDFMNNQDFAAISYYPFLHNALTVADFQATFEFLHQNIQVPIAFSETGYLAEDLVIPNYNVYIQGSQSSQNAYLQTLLNQAQLHQYLFVTWFSHRDYDALWETFPPEIQDLGKIWRDTGILDESGESRKSKTTWDIASNKNHE